MGQESWLFPYWSLHSKWRSNILLLLQPIFQVQETIIVVESWNSCYILKLHLTFKCEDYIWCISMQCLMHFVSVLDNHPLFERLRLCFERAKSEISGCETSGYFWCDISRWIVIFLDEVYLHTSFRPWNWWKLLLMPSKVCDISECPFLLTLYLNPREDLRSFPWRDIYYLIIPSMLWFSLFQCWWWWECEILLVKDFTTSPQISLVWELKLDLDQGWGWDLGSLCWNGWYMLYFMTFAWHLNLQVEPGLRSVIEDSPCFETRATPAMMIISLINPFIAVDWSPERTFLSRELNRAIDEELGISILQYTIKHFWCVIFSSLFLSWRFWCAFSGYLTGVWASLPCCGTNFSLHISTYIPIHSVPLNDTLKTD